MAITLKCPRCTHVMKVDDDKAGKEVPCKICHHKFKLAGGADLPKVKAVPDPKGNPGVKAGAPAGNGKAKAAPPMVKAVKDDDDDSPRSKRRRDDDDDEDDVRSRRRRRDDDDDDDDDDRPSPRRRRQQSSGGGMMFLLLGGGALLLVLLLCGGGGVGVFFLFSGAARDEEFRVAAAELPMEVPPPPPIVIPAPPGPQPFPPGPQPFPQPFPQPIPPQPQPPFGREVLDPNDPKNIDRVITLLNGPENERGAAFTWLNAANEKHARRKEVATILENQVNQYMTTPPTFGNDGLFTAFFKWATKDNVPAIANVAEKARFTVWDNKYREEAMKTLGKMKDPRGADALVKNLGNAFFGRGASAALADMGSAAEPALLKAFNHPDGNARGEARRIIQTLNTRSDVIVTQCIADLDSAEENRRKGAVNWFATAAVDQKRKADVARALNKSIPTANFFFEKDLIKALQTWGTGENVPTLVQRLEANKTGNNEVIQILGKIRDVNGMKAVAKSMSNFFNQGEAKKVLREYGPGAEALVVEQMNLAADAQARKAYVQFLGEIGTRNSLPALQQLAFRNQQDRFLLNDIAAAQKAIFVRGK